MSELDVDIDGALNPVTIGLVSISDRASTGVYADEGIPALKAWLQRAVRNPITWETRLIPDVEATIGSTLRELVDRALLRSGAHHGRHRPRVARRDAGGHLGRGHQGAARVW